jgi:CRISPR-associated protein Csy2
MKTCPDYDFLLVLPHLRVQNANAISSPLTHGFPSVTALLGLTWALSRQTQASGLDLDFTGFGVICHDFQEQSTHEGFVGSFCLTRNPIGKDGSTAAIVEEGRIHLEVSLVLAVNCPRWLQRPEEREADCTKVAQILAAMRLAGGTFLPPEKPWQKRYQPYAVDFSGNEDDRHTKFRAVRMRLLPGFALVARDDLLAQRLAELQATQPQASRLDAWLSLARINWRFNPKSEENPTQGEWQHDRKGLGWVVPIPVGYGALAPVQPAGSVANARDMDTPFRLVESLYSIGQWISPHRLQDPTQLLWYAQNRPEEGLYRCSNDYATDSSDSAELHYEFD